VEEMAIGLGGWDHDAAAALIGRNRLTLVGEEERFTRLKHQGQRHSASIRFCLYGEELRENPSKVAFAFAAPRLVANLRSSLADSHPRLVSNIIQVDHHLSHATAAFALSGFRKALVLAIDGYGDSVSTSAWSVDEAGARLLWSISDKHSIGLLWMSTNFLLGFGMRDSGKVMGLAAYGTPRYTDILLEAIQLHPDGRYEFDRRKNGDKPFLHSSQSLFRKIKGAARKSRGPLEEAHMDIAASLQEATEVVVMHSLRCLVSQYPHSNLCLTGGVALNSVMNGKILKSGLFEKVFVPPNPGDSGTCIGSALVALGTTTLASPPTHAYFGERYSGPDIKRCLEDIGIHFTRHENIEEVAARLLESGKILGWFQGRAEMGPRALGNRSILADPRGAETKDIVNRRIKHREWFRPFAPVVIENEASKWFELKVPSPYMLFVSPVIDQQRQILPATTHRDGTARVQTINEEQNPRLHRLLREFQKLTDVPVLLNTSFNVMGEPIVNSPRDAISTLLATELDYVVLDDYLVAKPT
jgi:carbamoyltransferase